MKKLIFIALIVILLLPGSIALASDISGALYRMGITVTNSSTAATNVATVATISTPNLIAGGFCSDAVTNITIKNSAGGDVPFMPGYNTNPWVLFVPSIGANAQINDTLYTADSSGGDIAYFPGSGGMTTLDAAGMEPGNNFTDEWSGYLDSSSSDTAVLSKTGSITLTHNGSTLTAAIKGGAPSVAATNTTNTPSGTSHPVNLPTSIVSGNLLVVSFQCMNSGALDINWPGGWTELAEGDHASGYAHTAVAYRQANGTEGSTITVSTTASGPGSAAAYRITGWQGTPEISAVTTGTTVNPDAASLTPSWGTWNNLWIAVCGWGSNSDATLSGWPASYGVSQIWTHQAGASGIAMAGRTLNAASENPGAFTLSGDRYWVAFTVAIKGDGDQVSASITGAGGDHVYKTSSDGTWLMVQIDGNTSWDGVYSKRVALGGVSAPNTSANWVFGSNATLYIRYYKHWVNGMLKQQITWEYYHQVTGSTLTNGTGIATGSPINLTYGNNTITVTTLGTFTVHLSTGINGTATSGTTTVSGSPQKLVEGDNTVTTTTSTGSFTINLYSVFHDLSGNSNHVNPTYRTTTSDADVTATAVSFQPISEAKAPLQSLESSPAWLTGTPSISGNFTSSDTTAKYPGAAVIAALADASATPKELPQNIIAGFIIIALSFSTSAVLRKNMSMTLFVKGFLIALLMGIAVALQVFDFWMVVVFLYFAITVALISADPRWG